MNEPTFILQQIFRRSIRAPYETHFQTGNK